MILIIMLGEKIRCFWEKQGYLTNLKTKDIKKLKQLNNKID